MEVRLVNVDQSYLLLAHLIKEGLKLLNESGSFLWTGLLEHLLTLLPTQTILSEDDVQGASADFTVVDLFNPMTHFLGCPVVPWQALVDGFALFYGRNELIKLILTKKGVRPPVHQ
jgi:hypothetical protein